MENWKDIPGYEGRYQASDSGEIKRICRTHMILKQTKTNTGYFSVGLNANGKQKTCLVHRLVTAAFYGWEPEKDVNHINGVKTDNRVENLQWCTRSENIKHAFKLGLSRNHLWMLGKVGAANARAKPVIQKAKSGQEVARFTCIKEAAFTTGIAESGISAAARGVQKTAGKCLWEFA